MASSKEYLDFILEQLTGLEGISYRAMMGEYILYYKNKVIGGIYDNRFLLKITESSEKFIPNAKIKIPYEGAKGMLLFDDFENKEFLVELFEKMYEELPMPKIKKKK
jgi:tfoX N-domain family protein